MDTKFICERCLYETINKGDLKKHLEKKKVCNVKEKGANIDREDLLEKLYPNANKEKKYKCGCGKSYEHSQSLYNHRKTCLYVDTDELTPEKIETITDIKFLQKIITNQRNRLDNQTNMRIAELESELILQENQYETKVAKFESTIDKLNLKIASMKKQKNEDFYQKILEEYYGGKHKRLKCGETDITTDTMHIEIKIWNEWKAAIGQLVCYNGDDPKEHMHACFFGKYAERCREMAIAQCKALNIEVFWFEEDESSIYLVQEESSGRVVVFDKTTVV